MNPRIPYASVASRGVLAPVLAPGVLRVDSHSSFVIARRALTLVEMLIGMAITLLMMAAIVNLFANIGSGVRVRRAAMEMGGQLRMVRATLFNDLAGATCRALPWQRPDEDPGYIEIIEGGFSDKDPTGLVLDPAISQVPGSQITPAGQMTDGMGLGDFDDILALTVRGEAAPFRGRLAKWDPDANNGSGDWITATIESSLAEVVWYAVENPDSGSQGEPGMRSVYRRVLLIAPWIPTSSQPLEMIPPYTDQTVTDTTESPPVTVTVRGVPDDNEAYRYCDVSFRREGDLRVPNTLGDLTKRENRFAHQINGITVFPHEMNQRAIRVLPGNTFPTGFLSVLHPFGTPFEPAGSDPDRQGEDLMLSNVLAFDLLVFDPWAPLFEYQNAVIEPVSSSLFTTAQAINLNNLVGFGAYVDLGWDDNEDYVSSDPSFVAAGAQLPPFQQERQVTWHPSTPNANRGTPAVYDAWSFHYEHDGLDQDGDDQIDEGTNGLDDDGVNGVDDIGERETSPPYPVPLRGMQVKIRIYDPDTRQIREATVTRNFVPQ